MQNTDSTNENQAPPASAEINSPVIYRAGPAVIACRVRRDPVVPHQPMQFSTYGVISSFSKLVFRLLAGRKNYRDKYDD